MKKFMVIYYMPASIGWKTEDSTPEEKQEGMKKWMEWKDKCGDGLVDMGNPLGNAKKVTPDGISDGNKDIAGYSILQSEDMEGAIEMLKNHPHLTWNAECEIEVYEVMPMM